MKSNHDVYAETESRKTFRPMRWIEQAACRGAQARFFTVRGENGQPAKQVCAGCPVVAECANHALNYPEVFGTWGGMSERDRRTARASR